MGRSKKRRQRPGLAPDEKLPEVTPVYAGADVVRSRTAWLYRLDMAAEVVRRNESEIRVLVDRAREAGASWRDVGLALGTSPQAAHQRFRRQGGARP